MKKKSIKELVDRYQKRILKHGKTFESLSSGSREHQSIRFDIQKNIGIKNGDSVLDIGCGIGDFYGYLKKQGISVDYYGVDLVPDLIAESQTRYPECGFEVKDILTEPFEENSFDYIVSSQAMNYKFTNEHNIDHAKQMLEKMNFFAKKGVVCDFLTKYVDFQEDHLYYYNPEEILRICKSLTKRVDLIHSYPLFEFSVYLFPDFKGWSE